MLSQFANPDIQETLRHGDPGELEDEIFVAMERVQALCAMQTALEESDGMLAPHMRSQYARVVEEQVARLRSLLIRRFE